MKILITGHKGYVGTRLYSKLESLGYNVFGLDLKDGIDICYYNYDKKIDYIFHLAALPSVKFSIENPSYTMKHNVYATSRVLEIAKKCNAKRVIFSSSSAIYGNGNGPESPYGMQKLMCEQECVLYSKLYKIDTVSLRYFNLFSEDQKFGGPYSSVICSWIKMLEDRKPIVVYGDGEQSRDFIHVDDVISANLFCMNYKDNFEGKFFDVGLGESISLNSIIDIIKKYQKNIKYNYKNKRPGEVLSSVANLKNGLQSLGWQPKIKPRDEFQEYFSKNFSL